MEIDEGLELETRKDLSLAAENVRTEVAASLRGSIEHLRYATPRVQLAWGQRAEDGRIRHVNAVDNGRSCACSCPACGEELISRQGQVRAWHFAHHNGKECRNAVSAAVSRFLAQWLQDGQGLDLPPVTYTYGGRMESRPARAGMTFLSATAIEDEATGHWEVRADAGAPGRTSALRIIIRTNPRAKLPSGAACRDEDLSTMVIDLGAVLAIALDIEPDLCTNEAWMTEQVITEAPRFWLWTKASDRLREAEIERRVGRLIAAIAHQRKQAPDGRPPSNARAALEATGLAGLLTCGTGPVADIDGAFIFGRSREDWRAEIILETILRPIARALPGRPAYLDTVVGWRQSGLAFGRAGMLPDLLMKRIETEDLVELRLAHPDFVEPVRVVDQLYEALAEARVLRRRPSRKLHSRQTDIYDPELWNVKGGSFSVSPGFLEDIRRALSAAPEKRDILLGKMPVMSTV